MNNIIEIRNLNFSYKDNKVFEDLNLTIKNKKFVTILGKSSTGKSTLAKILVGLLKAEGDIVVDGVLLQDDSLEFVRKKIGIVFENSNSRFVQNIVYDDLAFTLENMNYYQLDIDGKICDIAELLGIEHLLKREIVTLSEGEKQLVNLASALIYEPNVLIIDNAFSMIDSYYKEIILKTLNILRKRGLTIINLTSNPEETLYGTDVIILNDGQVALNKTTLKALKEEKTFINCGLKLPFVVDLSLKLNYYDLVDKIYLDEKSLVDEIWK